MYVECGHWPWRQVAGDGPLGFMVRHGRRVSVDEWPGEWLVDGVFTFDNESKRKPLFPWLWTLKSVKEVARRQNILR